MFCVPACLRADASAFCFLYCFLVLCLLCDAHVTRLQLKPLLQAISDNNAEIKTFNGTHLFEILGGSILPRFLFTFTLCQIVPLLVQWLGWASLAALSSFSAQGRYRVKFLILFTNNKRPTTLGVRLGLPPSSCCGIERGLCRVGVIARLQMAASLDSG
jgi:hypothetical protein